SERKTIRTLENERARFAYNCVKKVKKEEEKDFQGKYKSYSKRIMAMIKINGVAAVLAFMKSGKEAAYNELYKNIEEWLKNENCPMNAVYNNAVGKDMIEKVISMNSPDYRAITREVLEFTNWLKRFAEGMI